MKTKPRSAQQSTKRPTRQATTQAARPPAAKPRGAKGHFFTAPVSPRREPARGSTTAGSGTSGAGTSGARTAWSKTTGATSAQTPRPRSPQAGRPRDGAPSSARPANLEPLGEAPLNAVPRGTKVRSRRPTGAQELRAQRIREEAQYTQQRQAIAHGAARPTKPSATHAGTRPPAAPQRITTPVIDFHLTGDYIALDNLLKLTGTAPSGGAAKALAAAGAVRVDRIVELRKTCKIRAGQLVETADAKIRVRAAPPPATD